MWNGCVLRVSLFRFFFFVYIPLVLDFIIDVVLVACLAELIQFANLFLRREFL